MTGWFRTCASCGSKSNCKTSAEADHRAQDSHPHANCPRGYGQLDLPGELADAKRRCLRRKCPSQHQRARYRLHGVRFPHGGKQFQDVGTDGDGITSLVCCQRIECSCVDGLRFCPPLTVQRECPHAGGVDLSRRVVEKMAAATCPCMVPGSWSSVRTARCGTIGGDDNGVAIRPPETLARRQ